LFFNAHHEAPNTAMTLSKKYSILSQAAEIHLHAPIYLLALLDAQRLWTVSVHWVTLPKSCYYSHQNHQQLGPFSTCGT